MNARRSTLGFALMILGLVYVSSATATPPTTTEQVFTTPLVEIAALTRACGFTVLGSSTFQVRSTDFSQPDGTTIRRTHLTIDGTLVRASTGKTLLTHARWLETRDFDQGTGTISGLRFVVHAPGEPPVDMSVGHAVTSSPAGFQDPDLITPGIKFPVLDPAAVCAALS